VHVDRRGCAGLLAVSTASKLMSPAPCRLSLWSEIARTFVPSRRYAGEIAKSWYVRSAPSNCASTANVVLVMVPAGMLSRTTSTPFRYATMPSSRRTESSSLLIWFTPVAVNDLRK
jgi:hypothetical protein